MAHVYPDITTALAQWIARQPLFFVGTAPLQADGHVNVSPKGPIGTLRVLSPTEVAYLDIVGSGAETAAHLQENGRIVVMLCSFEGPPRILRLHGRGSVVWPGAPGFEALRERCDFEEPEIEGSRRAIVRVDVTRIADSCGYGVPVMEYVEQRSNMTKWVRGKLAKSPDAIEQYKVQNNLTSIDGLPALPGDAAPAVSSART